MYIQYVHHLAQLDSDFPPEAYEVVRQSHDVPGWMSGFADFEMADVSDPLGENATGNFQSSNLPIPRC